MARSLKTYTTQIGFFDLAIAAPSMKAALEAWGAQQNLFHQGFAEETDDPEITAAALASPGVVLKRAVGTKGAFKENAELPQYLPAEASAKKVRPKPKTRKLESVHPRKEGTPSDRAQVLSFQKAQAKRAAQRAKEEVKRAKQEAANAVIEERRQNAIQKLQEVFDRARENHEHIMAEIEKGRTAIERKADNENNRWGRQKREMEVRLQRTKD